MNVKIEDILKITKLQLGQKNISEDDRFMEDLGAESADVVNIVASVEDKYDISFDDEDISDVRTVRELFDRARKLLENQSGSN